MRQSKTNRTLGFGNTQMELPKGLARVKHEPVRVYNGFIQGIMQYGFTDLKDYLETGDVLTLQRDVDNDYDSYAVGVYWKGVQLGYLGEGHNVVIANLLDSGVGIHAYISKVDMEAAPQHTLAVVLFADFVVALPTLAAKFSPSQTSSQSVRYQSA